MTSTYKFSSGSNEYLIEFSEPVTQTGPDVFRLNSIAYVVQVVSSDRETTISPTGSIMWVKVSDMTLRAHDHGQSWQDGGQVDISLYGPAGADHRSLSLAVTRWSEDHSNDRVSSEEEKPEYASECPEPVQTAPEREYASECPEPVERYPWPQDSLVSVAEAYLEDPNSGTPETPEPSASAQESSVADTASCEGGSVSSSSSSSKKKKKAKAASKPAEPTGGGRRDNDDLWSQKSYVDKVNRHLADVKALRGSEASAFVHTAGFGRTHIVEWVERSFPCYFEGGSTHPFTNHPLMFDALEYTATALSKIPFKTMGTEQINRLTGKRVEQHTVETLNYEWASVAYKESGGGVSLVGNLLNIGSADSPRLAYAIVARSHGAAWSTGASSISSHREIVLQLFCKRMVVGEKGGSVEPRISVILAKKRPSGMKLSRGEGPLLSTIFDGAPSQPCPAESVLMNGRFKTAPFRDVDVKLITSLFTDGVVTQGNGLSCREMEDLIEADVKAFVENMVTHCDDRLSQLIIPAAVAIL